MPDFGSKLREARERRGVSLRQISDHTKISVAALESLERNDPSRLPGGIFTRSFVRSYAVEVGLDPDAIVREFLARFKPEPLGIEDVDLAAEEARARANGLPQRALSMLLKIVVASLVLVAIILYLTRDRYQDDPSSEPRTDSARRTSRRAVPPPDPGLGRLPELS
jgi:cytoskeleton protein RodZ